jgi:hypothetical protein
MGIDHHIPDVDVEYRRSRIAGSAAEEQLDVFTSHGDTILGPADGVWTARPDVP